MVETRKDEVIAEPVVVVAVEANTGNTAIENEKAEDMDKENDAITEIIAKIAVVKEKKAAIRAEYKREDKVERVPDGNRGWTIYDCE